MVISLSRHILRSRERLAALMALAMLSPLAVADDTPLPFSAASTPLASQVLEQQWAESAQVSALDWRYSFVSTPLIRQQMADKANRLSAELELIAARYAVGATPNSPQARYVTALQAWQHYVAQGRLVAGPQEVGRPTAGHLKADSNDAAAAPPTTERVLARIPGQLDPRRDMRAGPQAIRIAPGMVIGACQAPRNIVIMDATGVHQRKWSPNLTLDALIDERSAAEALGPASQVSLVTPQGQVLTRPIARWNRLTSGDADLPIAPGASVVISTPGLDTAQKWVNQALPEWLASRLPGHDCQSWQLDAATLPDTQVQ